MTKDQRPSPTPIFPLGKLPPSVLRSLLGRLRRPDASLIIGPDVGEDAAVIAAGDRWLVVTTDPITFATDRIGWYAVHVNANDVAVMGARPRWFSMVLLAPEGAATADMVARIVEEVAGTCAALDVTICGGHTEVCAGLDRPIVIGQMIGEVERARLVRKSALRPGDRIILTRGAAIEGTALLAREAPERLRQALPADVLQRSARLLDDPGISIVEAARIAAESGGVRAMHDPTEGGVAAGLWELAAASGCGLRIHPDRIAILPETSAVCGALGLDPLRLLASGALLIGAAGDRTSAVVEALGSRGIPATVVADVVDPGVGVVSAPGDAPVAPPGRDEIARIFERTGAGSQEGQR